MILSAAGDCLVFATFCLGLGILFAAFIHGCSAFDRLSLGIGAAVVCLYLACFAIYLLHLPPAVLWLLAFVGLAANAHTLPPPWVRLWIAGLACDFVFGIALQFGVQSLWLDRWLAPGRAEIDYILQLSQPAAANYFGKLRVGAVHLADGVPPFMALLLLGTTAAFALSALRTGRREQY